MAISGLCEHFSCCWRLDYLIIIPGFTGCCGTKNTDDLRPEAAELITHTLTDQLRGLETSLTPSLGFKVILRGGDALLIPYRYF